MRKALVLVSSALVTLAVACSATTDSASDGAQADSVSASVDQLASLVDIGDGSNHAVVVFASPAGSAPVVRGKLVPGGKLSVETYCQDSRGLFGNFFRKLFAASDAKPYAPADQFDAVLHVDGLDQKVTQVTFVRRAAK